MAPQPVPSSTAMIGRNKTGEEMDEEREQQIAYQYLCHLEEAKNWISACIQEQLPSTTDLEESLRNGVYLAKLAHFFAPEVVPKKRIFDSDFRKFHESGLHFRHTDNINYFLQAIHFVGLPEIFRPETTDIYDRKNMPRVIFCIHALSLFLFKLGIAPQIQDLYGKVTFTDEEISHIRTALEVYGLPMPQFRKIGGMLANEVPVDEAALHAAIIAINEALDEDSWELTYQALLNPVASLEGVDGENAQKYHVVLRSHKNQKIATNHERTLNDSYVPDAYDEMLSQVEIQGHLAKVNLLVMLEKVEEVLLSNDTHGLLQALRSRALNLKAAVKPSKINLYMAKLQEAMDQAEEGFLRADAIDRVVSKANNTDDVEELKMNAVGAVNSALSTGDPNATLLALQNPVLGLKNINAYTAPMYLSELKYIKETSGVNLRYEGIFSLCEFLNVIGQINQALEMNCKPLEVWSRLSLVEANIEDLRSERINDYCNALRAKLVQKRRDSKTLGDLCPLLLHSEVQTIVDEVNIDEERTKMRRIPEHIIIQFQARVRGFLARQRLFNMLQYYSDNEHRVIRAQAVWRGIRARRVFHLLVQEVCKNRPRFKPLSYYIRHEKGIVKIQRAWRQHKSRVEFENLMKNKEMSLPVVRKYLHLLDMRNEDFDQELSLQGLKADITKSIRNNQHLEKNINEMDIKIGLLVKNRISVQDVVAHSRTMNNRGKTVHRKNTFNYGLRDDTSTINRVGLKALKKESREKLEAYQNFFYLLQTNPNYLAKLVFAMPQMKTTKFLESVILTLYNFGSNQREEYLLLKLFQTSLEEEIRCKVNSINDIVSGHPLVVKMIVSFNRSGKGQLCLKEMLGPLINRVLEDKNLQISTNPVEIYKQWLNQLEMESGRSSGMPYDVNVATALEHQEVQKRLQRSITKLKQISTLFLTTILKSKNKLPYGILYMAKVMFNSLREKFPDTPVKEVLKIIGNLIYYRYINSAIVAPDSCDIVEVNSSEQALNNEQRKNLGSIAKVLQFAASKKGFGDESAHLMCLNQYIVESHEKLKAFFLDCCNVQEPEQEFAMDQYYEATLLAKPVIYISLSEICDTHQLVLDYRYQIALGENDPLHEILDDLGGSPSLCSLLGAADLESNNSDSSLAHLGQTEVCLTLTNKLDLSPVDHLDVDSLFVKTKQLISFVLPCTNGSEKNLLGCLKSKPTLQQIEYYWQLVEKKEEVDKMAENNKSMLNHTNLFRDDDVTLPLDDCKRQILKNLQILERHGYVSKKDDFQSIIVSLGRDIVNQKHYRTRRRKEIFRLKRTLATLEEKRKFYEDQVEYYNQYLKKCLANLQAEKATKKVRFSQRVFHHSLSSHSSSSSNNNSSSHRKLTSKQSIRYSGAKLHEKGILQTIEGLPANQFKNVQFEFLPSNVEDGVFEIHARFMGVQVEHVEVDIQELLQLQYEGVSVMNMFGKARINVNLLLHFLNVKFFGKHK